MGNERALRPKDSTSAATLWPASGLISQTTMSAPSCASISTLARPIPLPPPVTMATRPASCICPPFYSFMALSRRKSCAEQMRSRSGARNRGSYRGGAGQNSRPLKQTKLPAVGVDDDQGRPNWPGPRPGIPLPAACSERSGPSQAKDDPPDRGSSRIRLRKYLCLLHHSPSGTDGCGPDEVPPTAFRPGAASCRGECRPASSGKPVAATRCPPEKA